METHWPELLALHLDLVEELILKELSDPSTARGKRGKPIPGVDGANLRQLDLMQALERIAAAREELVRCPEGAQLAMLVSSVELNRLRLPVEVEKQRHQGVQKGAHAPKRKAKRSAVQRHARLQRQAAELGKKNPKLTITAKAKILARTSKLSAERIRHIIH
jgi:hypothetical protein